MFVFNETIEAGDVIAVGDIHARYDLFSKFLDHVRGSQACVILLGDIVDRGGQDLQVLNKVKELIDEPQREGLLSFHCLMGNHEAMLLDAHSGPSSSLLLWSQNGGNMEDYSEIWNHVDWIKTLPIYMVIGETMFIHAGFYPGKDPNVAINSGRTENLLWMRDPFLSFGPKFEEWAPHLKQVVFGHTPKGPLPYKIPQGVCIDTAAYNTGILTSYNVTRDTFFQYEADNVESTPAN
jgi:serine/threonine protein phosphatase 1